MLIATQSCDLKLMRNKKFVHSYQFHKMEGGQGNTNISNVFWDIFYPLPLPPPHTHTAKNYRYTDFSHFIN